LLARVRSPSELLYSRFTSQKPRFLDQFKEGGYNIASRIATVKRPTTVNQGSGTTGGIRDPAGEVGISVDYDGDED